MMKPFSVFHLFYFSSYDFKSKASLLKCESNDLGWHQQCKLYAFESDHSQIVHPFTHQCRRSACWIQLVARVCTLQANDLTNLDNLNLKIE